MAGFKKYTITEGYAKGLDAVDVDNGTDFRFTVF